MIPDFKTTTWTSYELKSYKELFRPSTMGHHSSEFCIPCSINSANILFGNSTDIPGSFKGYRQSIVIERYVTAGNVLKVRFSAEYLEFSVHLRRSTMSFFYIRWFAVEGKTTKGLIGNTFSLGNMFRLQINTKSRTFEKRYSLLVTYIFPQISNLNM